MGEFNSGFHGEGIFYNEVLKLEYRVDRVRSRGSEFQTFGPTMERSNGKLNYLQHSVENHSKDQTVIEIKVCN